jgi:Glycosyl transferase family 2
MSPLLSVALPTHNRARYALHAIRSMLAIADPRLEVVVSDTSTDGELEAALKQQNLLQDARLSYQHPVERLDMTGNHNAALARCRGRFVCVIGDDDTITADLLPAAEWAERQGIQALVPNVVANYVWPDFRSLHFGAGHAGRLYFARHLDGAFKQCDPALALQAALQLAAQGTDELPKLYHGLVQRELLETMKRRSGQYVHGSSPDMSAAIGLTQVCSRFVSVNYPLTVPGASGGSNTGCSAMKQHKGPMGDDAQTRAFLAGGWSPGVPRFFAVETVWAHAALDTLRHYAPDAVLRFNYPRLLAACRMEHPEYVQAIAQAEHEAMALLGLGAAPWQQALRAATWTLRREKAWKLARRLRHPTVAGGRAFVPDLPTIAAVGEPLAQHLRRKGLDWTSLQSRFEAG